MRWTLEKEREPSLATNERLFQAACRRGRPLRVRPPVSTLIVFPRMMREKYAEGELLFVAEIDNRDVGEAAAFVGQRFATNPARRPRTRLDASAQLTGGDDIIELQCVRPRRWIKQVARQRRVKPSTKLGSLSTNNASLPPWMRRPILLN